MSIERSKWHRLYKKKWGNETVSDAMGHPAKYQRGLIQHIYRHAIEEGWVAEGDTILDPFGGVALGALDAMRHGLTWVGVEVEGKDSENDWVSVGNANIAKWNKAYGDIVRKPAYPNDWGKAILLHGDSRYLGKVLRDNDEALQEIDLSVGSPPFRAQGGGSKASGGEIDSALIKRHSAGNKSLEGYGSTDGNIANMDDSEEGFRMAVGSPAYGNSQVRDARHLHFDERRADESIEKWQTDPGKVGYGKTEGQMSDMPVDEEGLDMAVGSPPYADIPQSGGEKGLKKHGTGLTKGERAFDEYGEEEGQMGRMENTKDGYDLSVSSPPYAGSLTAGGNLLNPSSARPIDGSKYSGRHHSESKGVDEIYGDSEGQMGVMKDSEDGYDASISSPPYSEARIGQKAGQEQCGHHDAYGEAEGQLGSMKAEGDQSFENDFWVASRMVIDGVYQALKPGGHAIWIVKRFVKGGKIVPFPRQWAKVCVAAGFEVVHWHQAMVVEEYAVQEDLFGEVRPAVEIQRKSFFRILTEKKGNPEINWEDCICTIKPN